MGHRAHGIHRCRTSGKARGHQVGSSRRLSLQHLAAMPLRPRFEPREDARSRHGHDDAEDDPDDAADDDRDDDTESGADQACERATREAAAGPPTSACRADPEPHGECSGERREDGHSRRSVRATIRVAHARPDAMRMRPRARHAQPGVVPRSQPRGSPPMATPRRRPSAGSSASMRAVARGAARCASSWRRTSSALRSCVTMRSSASASPAPCAEATLQHAAAEARIGWPEARESSRRALTTSPLQRVAASVRGAIAASRSASARDSARAGGCPARTSATTSARASRSAARACVRRLRDMSRCRTEETARRARGTKATGCARGRSAHHAAAEARRAATMTVTAGPLRRRP